jgi:hypothetical protein
MRRLDCVAIHMNNFRVIPRIVIIWLLHTTWRMADWALHLNRPVTADDVALVGLFTGLFVATYKFYVDTGSIQSTGDRHEDHPPDPPQ